MHTNRYSITKQGNQEVIDKAIDNDIDNAISKPTSNEVIDEAIDKYDGDKIRLTHLQSNLSLDMKMHTHSSIERKMMAQICRFFFEFSL